MTTVHTLYNHKETKNDVDLAPRKLFSLFGFKNKNDQEAFFIVVSETKRQAVADT